LAGYSIKFLAADREIFLFSFYIFRKSSFCKRGTSSSLTVSTAVKKREEYEDWKLDKKKISLLFHWNSVSYSVGICSCGAAVKWYIICVVAPSVL
jgi:hypothetical protein